jgi:hypothetical protein
MSLMEKAEEMIFRPWRRVRRQTPGVRRVPARASRMRLARRWLFSLRWRETPEAAKLARRVKALGEVRNADGYAAGAAIVIDVKATTNAIEAHYKPVKQAIDRVKKFVLGMEQTDLARYGPLAKGVEESMEAWQSMEEYLAKERQREAEETARLLAEQERQHELEALRVQAEQVAQSPEMQAAIRQEIEAVANQALVPEKVHVQSAVPKVAGFARPTRYSAEQDGPDGLKLLVLAVAAGLLKAGEKLERDPNAAYPPIQAVQANQVFINQQATAMKEGFNIPGFRLAKNRHSRAGGK